MDNAPIDLDALEKALDGLITDPQVEAKLTRFFGILRKVEKILPILEPHADGPQASPNV